jgi:hypothetical protein
LEGKRLETVSTDIEFPTMDVGLAWLRVNDFSPTINLLHEYFRQSFMSLQMASLSRRK